MTSCLFGTKPLTQAMLSGLSGKHFSEMWDKIHKILIHKDAYEKQMAAIFSHPQCVNLA